MGDLYHQRYYPALFRQAGWAIVDESISGELYDEQQRQLLQHCGHLPDQLTRDGFDFVKRGDIPDGQFMRLIWELVNESFDTDLHRYTAVDYGFFAELYQPLFDHLPDEYALCGFLKDGRLVAYGASLLNHIEELCNPEGRKCWPGDVAREPQRFAALATAVATEYRGSKLFPALAVIGARHSASVYGHNLTWRRTSLRNPGTAQIRASSRVTHRHVFFGRDLA